MPRQVFGDAKAAEYESCFIGKICPGLVNILYNYAQSTSRWVHSVGKICLQICKLKSGKWQAQVASRGVRRSTAFHTKQPARDWAVR